MHEHRQQRLSWPGSARLVCHSVALLAACTIAGAAEAQTLPAAVRGCMTEVDDTLRLACFDREAAKAAMTEKQVYGLTTTQATAAGHGPTAADEAARILKASVVGITERPHDGFVATLDNGQVWAQNQMEAVRGVQVGDAVTIKPGALGSFWLVGPSGLSTKVHRVQ